MTRLAKQLDPVGHAPRGVVGTVHGPESLQAALRLKPGEVDLLELRIDGFPGTESALLTSARRLRFPLIVTVRSPEEGAAHPLPLAARAEWYHRFLEVASAVDVELSSLPALRAVAEEARRQHIGVILSMHDFSTTPTLGRLQSLAARASRLGADVFKCATWLRTPSDFYVLHRLVAAGAVPIPVAAMGMGSQAPASRLLLGTAGSALTYGYLDRPNAPGQIAATLIKPLLELLSAAGNVPE